MLRSESTRKLRAASALPLLVLALEATAFADTDPTPKESYPTQYPNAVSYGTGEFTVGVTAVTRLDALPDYFGLRGDVLVRMSEAGVFNSFEIVSGAASVADMAVLRGGGWLPGTDGVVSVGSDGLRRILVDPATNLSSSIPIAAAEVTGVQVRCGNVVGSWHQDIVVLDADRKTFRVYIGSASGFGATPEQFDVGANVVSDFDLARLYTTTSLDAVIVGIQNGFKAYRVVSGMPPSLLMSRTGAVYTQNQVETLHDHHAIGIDGFAWATYLTSLDRWAILGGSGGQFQPAFLMTPGTAMVGMSAGRIDNNGGQPGNSVKDSSDLAITTADASLVQTFLNQGSGLSAPAFTTSAGHTLIETGWSGTNSVSHATVRDLDGNRRGELMIGHLNNGVADLKVIYDADESPLDSGPEFDWIEDSGEWQFGDNTSTNSIVSGTFHALALGGTPMASRIWRQPNAAQQFSSTALSYCNGSTAQPSGSGGDNYNVSLLLDGTGYDDEVGPILVFAVKPSQVLSDGTQPMLLMAIEPYAGTESVLQQLPTVPSVNPYLTARENAVWSELNPIGQEAPIVVGKLPVKRLTPPQPPVPPPGPEDCPPSN